MLPEAPVPGLPLAQQFPLLHLDAQPKLLYGVYGLALLVFSNTPLLLLDWVQPCLPQSVFSLRPSEE